MSDIYYNKFSVPAATGINQNANRASKRGNAAGSEAESFNEILQNQIKMNSNLTFSKHAVLRVAERDVDLSNDSISRLDEGVRIAQSKGLNDTLIIVDKTAFIVNVKNNTVVTTVSGDNLRGNVFTNIDGTVII
jgi:flagellar operon protein